MDPSLTTSDMLHFEENEMGLARGLALQESLRFHDYEYDPEHSLSGVTNKTYLEPTDILWSAIARVLPYCPFSKTIQTQYIDPSDILLKCSIRLKILLNI